MKHYMQYHKVHEIGRPTSSQGDFRAFTGKKVSDAYLGQTIWLLSGEKQNGKIIYQLEYAFIVSVIEPGMDATTLLREHEGYVPSRPTPVRFASWFVAMQKRTRNFSNGLSPIPDELLLEVADALGWKT